MLLIVSVTEFKARCLEFFDQLQNGSLDRIEVTRRNRLIAVVKPPLGREDEARAVHGSMASMTSVASGVDLTAPVFEGVIDAAEGVLHR